MIVRRSSTITVLLFLYAFLAPLGNLARFGQQESVYGVTTILLLLIALLALPAVPKGLQKERIFRSFLVLIVWLIAASVLAPEPLAALVNGGTLVLYLIAAITAFCYLRDEFMILDLLFIYCLGGLVGALATIIDFIGIVDIPGVNEANISTDTELGSIMQLSGVFPRRSAMAAYYTLIITIGILLPLRCSSMSIRKNLFFFSQAACA